MPSTASTTEGARCGGSFALYRLRSGLHLFRGFRAGLAAVMEEPPLPLFSNQTNHRAEGGIIGVSNDFAPVPPL